VALFSGLTHLRDEVSEGRFQRGLAITAAFFGLLNGGEVYFEHLRGSFSQRWMWTPVWLSPFMVGAGVGAFLSARVARTVLPFVSLVTLVEGVLGFGLHLRGVSRMAGHFRNLQFNVVMGPPLFAPLLFSSVGFLGLLAASLRRERSS
jgi:hypothetical protein